MAIARASPAVDWQVEQILPAPRGAKAELLAAPQRSQHDMSCAPGERF